MEMKNFVQGLTGDSQAVRPCWSPPALSTLGSWMQPALLLPRPGGLRAASLPNVDINCPRKGRPLVYRGANTRHRDFQHSAQSHVIGKWQKWGLNLGFSALELMLFL